MAQAARTASPERWVKAAARAINEQIEVRQIASTGQWIATSGTQANLCYILEVNRGLVLSCTCTAGQYNDPCCKHAARFYLNTGVLSGPDDDDGAAALVAA